MKTRKLLSMLLAAVMMLSTLTVGTTVSADSITYSDVNESMWSYNGIKYVTEKGLMNGISPPTCLLHVPW